MSELGDVLGSLLAAREPVTGNPATRQAIVLAGGRGTRLAPYTSVLPKPLMPIGERSILEIVVDQLGEHEFTNITLSVGYLSHLIQAVFAHYAHRDVQISYVHEERPLGTAAPLRLVDGLDETFVVMNGDVLTTLDYRDLVRHHCECGNTVTIATRERTIKIDYGVLDVDEGEGRVVGFREKPEVVSVVSMGIYVFEPRALEYIPLGEPFDFPDVVHALLNAGEPVGTYPFSGMWFDIGRHDDYEQASRLWAQAQGTPRRLAAAS